MAQHCCVSFPKPLFIYPSTIWTDRENEWAKYLPSHLECVPQVFNKYFCSFFLWRTQCLLPSEIRLCTKDSAMPLANMQIRKNDRTTPMPPKNKFLFIKRNMLTIRLKWHKPSMEKRSIFNQALPYNETLHSPWPSVARIHRFGWRRSSLLCCLIIVIVCLHPLMCSS